MSDIEKRLATLTLTQRKVLLKKLQAKNNLQQNSLPPIIRRQREQETNILPLSFAQERLWFLQHLDPQSTAYNQPTALRLHGSFSHAALHQALIQLTQRHEILRTTFLLHANEPIQVITPVSSIHLPVLNLQSLLPARREEMVRLVIQQEVGQPFDLSVGPLWRTTIIRLSEQEHVFLLTMHHIIMDGWSIGVLVQELTTLYHGAVSSEPISLPPLPIQYADYTLWQRNRLQGEVLQDQLNYWQQQLAEAPTRLDLPTDRPHPAVPTFIGARQELQLSVPLTQQLKGLSQREGVTLFMTLLAAFQVLLMRYSGQEDIVVGTPIANRTHRELEGLIGFFVNTLVLRGDLSGNPAFLQLLQRVRNITLQAYAHQDLPFETLVASLSIERSSSYNPLFQVFFVLQNMPQNELILDNLTWQRIEIEQGITKFDLAVYCWETERGLQTDIVYNTHLFEDQTIARLLTHWRALLTTIVDDSTQHIATLSFLSAIENTQLVEQWSISQREVYSELCLQQIFEQQVVRTPEAVAMVCGDVSITYDVLNYRANQLARYLQRSGLVLEDRVGLYFEKGFAALISMLAILKAGGAFIFLDPTLPVARVSSIVQDVHLKLLLTQASLLNRIEELRQHVPSLVCYEQLWHEERTTASDNLAPIASNQNLAYIVYTSGSTGRPKGVMHHHSGAANYLHSQRQIYHLQANIVALQITTFSFDPALRDILGPLSVGGRLVIPSVQEARDPEMLLNLIQQHQVTHIFSIAPSFLHALLETADTLEKSYHSVQLLLTTGESLQNSLVQHARSLFTALTVIANQYGPTEASQSSTYYRQPAATAERGDVPIGFPHINVEIYILDRQGAPVPQGVVGEVYIGGPGLARGYVGRPAETANTFVPHPLSREPGARLYRTGDLARHNQDGRLEYRGRSDNQIKLRGIRIEPGEIEAVLHMHEHVQGAVVVMHTESAEQQMLVAYVVVDPTATCSPEQLQAYLRTWVPDYMVPTTIMLLDYFPLTPNGKLDRRALPPPVVQHAVASVAPRSDHERYLAQLWQELLHVEQVGIHDNFFALGGHSLLATQLVIRIRHAFQLDLPLRAIFDTPTIAGLASHLSTQLVTIPALELMQRPQDLPLSFAQERLWFLQQQDPKSAAYHMPLAMRWEGPFSFTSLHQALNQLAARHESLRTTFYSRSPAPMQVISDPPLIQVCLLDLQYLALTYDSQLVSSLIDQEAQAPFNLETGPLWRTTIIQISKHEYVLLLTMHHIISDGWSIGVLIRDLSVLYHAAITGEPTTLPTLPIQYADYTLWQRNQLQGAVLQDQLHYWQNQLAGVPSVLDLPTDRPRPLLQTFVGARQQVLLSSDLSRQLNALSQREGVTLFMTLLAAFQVLLMRYSGQEDIVVGSPIANRMQNELEPLIGFFANTLALRSDLSGNPTFHHLLQRVRTMTLQAYAHQDLPFETLVASLPIERTLSYSPLFQVMMIMMVMQTTPQHDLTLDNLTWQRLEVPQTSSKFDLTANIQELDQQLLISLEYNTDLFDDVTITRFLQHWHTLFQGIVADVYQPVMALSLLSPEEHQIVVQAWNQTQQSYDPEISIHQRIAAQAQATPDAIALVFEEHSLTYRELDERSNQLAHTLQKYGVQAESLVGICLHRSPEMLIALLGVLKAGGSYVPIDPTYPMKRITAILEDSQVACLLTQQAVIEQLPLSTTILCLDRDWDRIKHEATHQIMHAPHPDQIAYVLYTSGSTGRPKGVQVSHGALTNLLVAMRHLLNPTETDIFLAVTTLSFDIAGLELYLPLLSGAQVHIVTREEAIDGQQLCRKLQSVRPTFMQATPATWRLLIAAGLSDLSFLTVLCGGDALPPDLVKQLLECTPVAFWNLYGPTETTIWSLTSDIHSSKHPISIGHPIANTQVYLLDRFQQLVPVGVPGEVYIGGHGLARGYHQQADLTAERFVPHPFSTHPGARLYRTGDLARYRHDGDLEFLGRIDHQVKLRGFRIELGEIEAVLNQHSIIHECVVILREDIPGERHLVAYVVLVHDEQAFNPPLNEIMATLTPQLRSFLQTRLMVYALPSYYVVLESLPLTPNGKVDRRALPVPVHGLSGTGNGSTFVAPHTRLQQDLVTLWEDLLHISHIGIRDNFFALGGHSLLAFQVVNWINVHFGVSFSVNILFQAQTIEQMEERLQQYTARQSGISLIVPLRAGGNKAPFFCVHPVSGNLYNYLQLTRYLDAEQPFYGIQAQGVADELDPLTGIEAMATTYVHALLAFQPQGPYLLGGHSMGGLIAFEMARQLEVMGKDVKQLILLDSILASHEETEQARLIPSHEIDGSTGLLEVVKYVFRDLHITVDAYLAQRPLEEQQRYILEHLKAAQVLPQEMDLPQFQKQLQIFQANAYSQRMYRPQGGYRGKVTLLYCQHRNDDPRIQWLPFAQGEWETQVVPGNHYSMLDEPFVRTVAERMQHYLDTPDSY